MPIRSRTGISADGLVATRAERTFPDGSAELVCAPA
jgi:hypothetical protein